MDWFFSRLHFHHAQQDMFADSLEDAKETLIAHAATSAWDVATTHSKQKRFLGNLRRVNTNRFLAFDICRELDRPISERTVDGTRPMSVEPCFQTPCIYFKESQILCVSNLSDVWRSDAFHNLLEHVCQILMKENSRRPVPGLADVTIRGIPLGKPCSFSDYIGHVGLVKQLKIQLAGRNLPFGVLGKLEDIRTMFDGSDTTALEAKGAAGITLSREQTLEIEAAINKGQASAMARGRDVLNKTFNYSSNSPEVIRKISSPLILTAADVPEELIHVLEESAEAVDD